MIRQSVSLSEDVGESVSPASPTAKARQRGNTCHTSHCTKQRK